jgi:hypothetical protein
MLGTSWGALPSSDSPVRLILRYEGGGWFPGAVRGVRRERQLCGSRFGEVSVAEGSRLAYRWADLAAWNLSFKVNTPIRRRSLEITSVTSCPWRRSAFELVNLVRNALHKVVECHGR